MTRFSNWRFDPFDEVFNYNNITGEEKTVPTAPDPSIGRYGFRTAEPPRILGIATNSLTIAEDITGGATWTEITGIAPSAGEYRIDRIYDTAFVEFNAADAGKQFLIDYQGKGGLATLIYPGTGNYGIGNNILNSTTSASLSIALGDNALNSLTSGVSNIGIGANALANVTTGNSNIGIGTGVLANLTVGSLNNGVGGGALVNLTTGAQCNAFGQFSLNACIGGTDNNGFGADTLKLCTNGDDNNAMGTRSQDVLTVGSRNNSMGTDSLGALTTGTDNSALGDHALSALTTEVNCSGLGANTAITGSNQVQLGDSATTTYAYGAVQNRSDARDKADVTDCNLGLDFILQLTPRQYKYDYREDYLKEGETDLTTVTKDGSKKRSRNHNGLIAQEVKEAMDKMGVDFAGYQDHSVAGGQDVLSLGYTELIAPLIKSIQELSTQVESLTTKVKQLESGV